MKSATRYLSALLCAGLLAALAAPVPAAESTTTYKLDPHHSQVHIWWNHLGFSNPGASFNISKGTLIWNAKDPAKSSVTVTIPVESAYTQVPVLTKEFKSPMFFDAAKYPTITFKSTHVQRIGQSDRYRVAGKLTVHGVTRPVTLRATLNKVGEDPMLHAPAIGFDANTTLKRSAFGIGAYVPIVSDLVHIRITAAGLAPKALAKETKAIEAEGKK
jgi:polyisoprenoid-binding protein YceI